MHDKLLEKGTVGWEPTAVLGGVLLQSSLTPTPPTHVHLGAGLPGLNDTGHSDIVLMFDGEKKENKIAQTINKCNLPDKNYCDTSLSNNTVTHWFNFFQTLCVNDW